MKKECINCKKVSTPEQMTTEINDDGTYMEYCCPFCGCSIFYVRPEALEPIASDNTESYVIKAGDNPKLDQFIKLTAKPHSGNMPK